MVQKCVHEGLVVQKPKISVIGKKIITSINAILESHVIHSLLHPLNESSRIFQTKKLRCQMICHIFSRCFFIDISPEFNTVRA